jgi:hypothetical protein
MWRVFRTPSRLLVRCIAHSTLPVPSLPLAKLHLPSYLPHRVGCLTLHRARMKPLSGLGMLRACGYVVTTMMLAP